jgi:hypothetical protein
VYLTAFLVQNGESLFQIAQTDSDSLVSPNLVVNEEQGSLTFKEGAPLKNMFFGDCSDEDVARATSLLVPQALAPMETPVRITADHFGRVPRAYMEGIVNLIFSLDEFSPLQPISRGQSGIYEREKGRRPHFQDFFP